MEESKKILAAHLKSLRKVDGKSTGEIVKKIDGIVGKLYIELYKNKFKIESSK